MAEGLRLNKFQARQAGVFALFKLRCQIYHFFLHVFSVNHDMSVK